MMKIKIRFTYFILFLTIFLNIGFLSANENISNTKIDDLDEIYSKLEEVDFSYIFGLDPDQPDDYTKYMYSPYPLFRSGVNLIFKSKTIPNGYYLLTPREKNGKTYVLFKENGKVKYVIPTYKEDIVLEEFYEDKIPHPKLSKYDTIRKKTMDFIGTKWGKKNQRTPIPKAYIEFDDMGVYWNMKLYYGAKKYYLLFKKD